MISEGCFTTISLVTMRQYQRSLLLLCYYMLYTVLYANVFLFDNRIRFYFCSEFIIHIYGKLLYFIIL